MSESEYSSLPLNDEIEQLIKDISDLEDSISDLEANLNSVGNGNPHNMYAYKQNWYDGTIYTKDSGGYDYQTMVTSNNIDVTNMRFLLAKMRFKWTGGSTGTKTCRVLLSDNDTDRTLNLRNLEYPIFSGSSEEPAEGNWVDYYFYIAVADLNDEYTVKFQARRGGVNVTIQTDEHYLYEQIINL